MSRGGSIPKSRLSTQAGFLCTLVNPITNLGSAVFAFEGVALIIPVYDAMENKHHFNRVLISSMTVICLVTFIMGIFPYLAFGKTGLQETFITE